MLTVPPAAEDLIQQPEALMCQQVSLTVSQREGLKKQDRV